MTFLSIPVVSMRKVAGAVMATGWGLALSPQNCERSFKSARVYANGFGLKSSTEWRAFCKSGKKPIDVPFEPNFIYPLIFKTGHPVLISAGHAGSPATPRSTVTAPPVCFRAAAATSAFTAALDAARPRSTLRQRRWLA